MWSCLCDPTFSRFSGTPTCDRDTDTDRHRQTDTGPWLVVVVISNRRRRPRNTGNDRRHLCTPCMRCGLCVLVTTCGNWFIPFVSYTMHIIQVKKKLTGNLSRLGLTPHLAILQTVDYSIVHYGAAAAAAITTATNYSCCCYATAE